jgi:hypothetical protein
MTSSWVAWAGTALRGGSGDDLMPARSGDDGFVTDEWPRRQGPDGLQVVAEGIETNIEQPLARQVGCDYGQGYLFSKPLPPNAIRNWLAQPERNPSLTTAFTST